MFSRLILAHRSHLDLARLCSSRGIVKQAGYRSNWRSISVFAIGGVVTGVVGFQVLRQRYAPDNDIRANIEASDNVEDASNTHGTTSHATKATSHASPPAYQSDASSTPHQGPWVMDEAMNLIVHRRTVVKNRLTVYMDEVYREIDKMHQESRMMGQRGEAWLQEQLANLGPQVDLQAQIILFGVKEPNARRRYVEQYGCSRWTDAALDLINSFGRIIEIGAGHGHWQHALTQRGGNVLAFDDGSALPMEGMPNVGKVLKGTEKELRKHRGRTLLLVYPGPTEMASGSLNEYRGKYLLYVGEPRGGVNANSAFFDTLEKNWVCESVLTLHPFPDGFEKLYVLRRKTSLSWMPRLW